MPFNREWELYITLSELGFLNVFENIDVKILALLFFRHL